MKQIEGNLLDFPEGITVIAHQANCQATMGSGIAAQIRELYPEAAQIDREAFSKQQAKLGLFSVAKISDDPLKIIVNLYGQFGIKEGLFGIEGGRDTDYEGLYEAIDKLFRSIKQAEKHDRYIVGFPYLMGCDRGGGDWRIVSAMIEVLEEKYGVKVIIVKYNETPPRTSEGT
jgi:O-acetyl-ADP-ribose deacetylase (regulator of RNase III)